MISLNTGQTCLLANLQTDKIQHGVSATLATRMPFIASPAPTSHTWVEFYSSLQCSRALLNVRRVNTITKREISIFLLNMGCVRAEVFMVNIDLRIALFSTSRTRSCWSRNREKKALYDSVTQCHCKRAHMKERIGENLRHSCCRVKNMTSMLEMTSFLQICQRKMPDCRWTSLFWTVSQPFLS